MKYTVIFQVVISRTIPAVIMAANGKQTVKKLQEETGLGSVSRPAKQDSPAIGREGKL
ncbi:hypothetical protein [Aestuariispira insulae]|uniref:hypothetical protein n=1 Tax=Aestuariispira insulae TaxID=1461337 RepID=UPI0015F297F7|nr:hypothetical protein [Aestuariispira insulae]